MKVVNLGESKSKINRELITKFGESIYSCNEVESILISVKFKDGSNISFKRAEMEDQFKDLIGDSE